MKSYLSAILSPGFFCKPAPLVQIAKRMRTNDRNGNRGPDRAVRRGTDRQNADGYVSGLGLRPSRRRPGRRAPPRRMMPRPGSFRGLPGRGVGLGAQLPYHFQLRLEIDVMRKLDML